MQQVIGLIQTDLERELLNNRVREMVEIKSTFLIICFSFSFFSLGTTENKNEESTLALIKAVKENDTEVLKVHLQSGANPNGKVILKSCEDKECHVCCLVQRTVVSYALEEEKAECLQTLVDAGAFFCSDDLVRAARGGSLVITEIILKTGIRPHFAVIAIEQEYLIQGSPWCCPVLERKKKKENLESMLSLLDSYETFSVLQQPSAI